MKKATNVAEGTAQSPKTALKDTPVARMRETEDKNRLFDGTKIDEKKKNPAKARQ